MDKQDTKNFKYSSQKDMGLFDPEQRLKALSDNSTAVEVDHNTPPRRYILYSMRYIHSRSNYMHSIYIYVRLIILCFGIQAKDFPSIYTNFLLD